MDSTGMRWVKTVIIFVVFVLIGLFAFYLVPKREPVVTNFEECIAAGNPVMESYPRQCRHLDKVFTEEIVQEVACADAMREGDVCAKIYSPVCATVAIQCITAPCDPIQETFSNACMACQNSLVTSYVPGECKAE